MLYDPKWEKRAETKADPFTLASFISWLETQNQDQEYNYYNCGGGCLLGLYMSALGVGWENGNYYDLHNTLAGKKTFGRIACEYPRTFGAALERARQSAMA